MAGDQGLLLGPQIVRELFLPRIADFTALARAYDVHTCLLYQRGNLNEGIDLYRACGINGLIGVDDANGMHLGELLRKYGREMCIIGGIDGRVLRGSHEDTEQEVTRKVKLARQGRVIPCLSTHVLPEVEFDKYRHYATSLRKAVEQ